MLLSTSRNIKVNQGTEELFELFLDISSNIGLAHCVSSRENWSVRTICHVVKSPSDLLVRSQSYHVYTMDLDKLNNLALVDSF